MYKVLGRKNEHREHENDLWNEVFKDCVNHISVAEIENLTLRTIVRLKSMSKDYKRMGYAWSGGKDSLVLHDLVRKSGVDVVGGVFVEYENEYPEFISWVKKNQPRDLFTSHISVFTLEYLNEHPNLLFPVDPKDKKAYIPSRWKAQNKWCIENNVDGLLTGRRTIDGNICGKNFITTSNNVDKINFMADWSQEHILAYIRYHQLELPPIYKYPNGWVFGTHCWTERNRIDGSIDKTFDELWGIDKRIIIDASKKLELAESYLKRRNDYYGT